jgi:hypothetical protein
LRRPCCRPSTSITSRLNKAFGAMGLRIEGFAIA